VGRSADRAAWREALADLRTYTRGERRAVHKPLMLLLLLARAARGASPDIRYVDFHEELSRLLAEFGPPRGRQQTEFPFWHLQSDGVWVVRDADRIPLRKGASNPARSTLVTRDATGHVPPAYWQALEEDPELRAELTHRILSEFWPPTLHEPIRQALGLSAMELRRERETVTRARRDRSFRDAVLEACGAHCEVCEYDGRLAGEPLAIEAAHLMWHCYGGPDGPDNGLALCSFHHVALDMGAIGIRDSMRVAVSPHVAGDRADEWLRRFDGRLLARSPGAPPLQPRFARWHAREVYRG
jgi:putative restriction endonuclease